jgi:hypothetical protein
MSASPKTFRQDMDGLRVQYETGDKSALALAIFGCARLRKPLPSWAADAWWDGYIKVAERVADWNDVLGNVKVRKPKAIQRDQKKLQQLAQLVKLLPSVCAPIERDSEAGAFGELGNKMGISPRAVRELYYMKCKYDGESIRVLSPHVIKTRGTKK